MSESLMYISTTLEPDTIKVAFYQEDGNYDRLARLKEEIINSYNLYKAMTGPFAVLNKNDPKVTSVKYASNNPELFSEFENHDLTEGKGFTSFNFLHWYIMYGPALSKTLDAKAFVQATRWFNVSVYPHQDVKLGLAPDIERPILFMDLECYWDSTEMIPPPPKEIIPLSLMEVIAKTHDLKYEWMCDLGESSEEGLKRLFVNTDTTHQLLTCRYQVEVINDNYEPVLAHQSSSQSLAAQIFDGVKCEPLATLKDVQACLCRCSRIWRDQPPVDFIRQLNFNPKTNEECPIDNFWADALRLLEDEEEGWTFIETNKFRVAKPYRTWIKDQREEGSKETYRYAYVLKANTDLYNDVLERDLGIDYSIWNTNNQENWNQLVDQSEALPNVTTVVKMACSLEEYQGGEESE